MLCTNLCICEGCKNCDEEAKKNNSSAAKDKGITSTPLALGEGSQLRQLDDNDVMDVVDEPRSEAIPNKIIEVNEMKRKFQRPPLRSNYSLPQGNSVGVGAGGDSAKHGSGLPLHHSGKDISVS